MSIAEADAALSLGVVPGTEGVLTPAALAFVAALARRFTDPIAERLAARRALQARLDAGERLDFLAETAAVRRADWVVAPLPPDLLRRKVEITGPTDRKMVINALNSGADVFMADFEDANSPTWAACTQGQVNLYDAVRRTITFEAPGRTYRLVAAPAVLVVRPRGLHLVEKHVFVDGRPVPGALFDFGLYVFHNAHALIARGSGPYFYLPKLESHLEARLWNDVFLFAEETLGLPVGTIKATVLIETIPAAFEMDEILWELREHAAGLNCGRWDYIFSFIKKHRAHPEFVLPDRAQVTMTQPFLRSYSQLAIGTCHRRGAFAMGGMAAQIPDKDPEKNRAAVDKVRADKVRERDDGHDGTWVAHPGLVPVAREVFDTLPGPNQLHVRREDVNVVAADLLRVPEGTRTEAGLRQNVRVSLLYLAAWLRGSGCVPIDGLMEDAATAEISRAQLWQWRRHGARLDDGRLVDDALITAVVDEERARIGALDGLDAARDLFFRLCTAETFEEFLTVPAYETLISQE